MEYEMPRRPHTVGGALPKVCVQSELIVRLLQEIEHEARGPVSKPKPPQKNHMKENLKRLKDIQAQAKQKIKEKQPLQPLRVPNHYGDVQSKILKNLPSYQEKRLSGNSNYNPPKTAGPFRSQPPLSPRLKLKSERMSTPQKHRSLPDLHQINDNEQVPETYRKDVETHRSDLESEKSSYSQAYSRKKLENKSEIPDSYNKDMRSPRSDAESEKSYHDFACSKKKSETKPEIRHRLGEIPNYLTERKKQWETERERQQKLREAASIPEGYTLLPDEERIETLELLKKNQEEILQSLAALPVRNDTIRLRSYKEELERQLVKVEEGIKIFSRPKVLIKNDT